VIQSAYLYSYSISRYARTLRVVGTPSSFVPEKSPLGQSAGLEGNTQDGDRKIMLYLYFLCVT